MSGFERYGGRGREGGGHDGGGGGGSISPGKRTLTAGLGPGPARDEAEEAVTNFGTNLRVTTATTDDLQDAIDRQDFDSALSRRASLARCLGSLEALAKQTTKLAAGREELAGQVDDAVNRAPAIKARGDAVLALAPEPGPDDDMISLLAMGMEESPERAARRERWLVKIGASAAGATPVPDPARGKIERATGVDLSGVTVNTGPSGAAVADAHDARAVAIGQSIHVGAGEDLHGADGERLLAHEVAHTIQAKGDGDDVRAAAKPRDTTAPDSSAEVEADDFADAIASGATPAPLTASLRGAVARAPRSGTTHTDKHADKLGGTKLDGGSSAIAPLALSSSALSFGDLKVGEESAPQSVAVTNVGAAPVDIEDVTALPPSKDFPTYAALGGPLAPGEGADLRFAFRPSEQGQRTATFHVLTDGGVSSATIRADGVGIPATFDTSPLSTRASLAPDTANALGSDERNEQALAARQSIAADPDHTNADNLEQLDWAAYQHGETLPPPPAGAGQLVVDGYTFSNDAAHMRYVLEAVIAQKGFKETAHIVVYLATLSDKQDETDARSMNLATRAGAVPRQQIPALAGRIYGELQAEADTFIHTFEATANQEIRRSLAQSEGSVHGSIAQYGLSWNDTFEKLLAPQIHSDEATPVSIVGDLYTSIRVMLGLDRPQLNVGNNEKLHELVEAARTLQKSGQDVKQKEAKRDQTAGQLATDPRYTAALESYLGHALDDTDVDSQVDEGLPDEDLHRAEASLADELKGAASGDPRSATNLPAAVDPSLVAASDDASAAKEDNELLTTGLEGQHAILAGFRGDLDELAGDPKDAGNDQEVAIKIAIKCLETMANIKKVRSGHERGEYTVWDLPRIIDAAKRDLQVVPGSWRDMVVFERIKQEQDDEAWSNFALTVLAVGLSVVAAIPSGGSSLMAGAAFVADVGAIGLDLYMAEDALQTYAYQDAAAHSDLDPYKAIADHEPSLANVIMAVAAAGIGLSSAVGLIRKAKVLRGLVARALEGDVEALARARVVRDNLNLSARQSGVGRRLGDDVVAESGEGSGNLFDRYPEEMNVGDDPVGTRSYDDGESALDGDSDSVDEIGLAEPNPDGTLSDRRVRHVDAQEMPPEMEADVGMSTLDKARLGIQRAPRHHTLPQESIEWFQAHGFEGREIDQFTVELDPLDHDMAHGGNQSLARRYWKEHEWNTELMRRLNEAEDVKKARLGEDAVLSKDEIMDINKDQMVEFQIDRPFVDYDSDDYVDPDDE